MQSVYQLRLGLIRLQALCLANHNTQPKHLHTNISDPNTATTNNTHIYSATRPFHVLSLHPPHARRPRQAPSNTTPHRLSNTHHSRSTKNHDSNIHLHRCGASDPIADTPVRTTTSNTGPPLSARYTLSRHIREGRDVPPHRPGSHRAVCVWD